MNLQVSPSGGGTAAVAYADTEPGGAPAVGDPALAMLALLLNSRGAESASATENVNQAQQRIEQTRRDIQEAMRRAAEAHEHSGFFHKLGAFFHGDIASICEIIGAAAMIGVTGGAGAPCVLAVAATGLCVSSKVAEMAGASPKVCGVLSGLGAAAGIALGHFENGPAIWEAIAKSAQVAGAGAHAAGVGADTAAHVYNGNAADDEADATAGRGEQNAAAFDFNLALDLLQNTARDTGRAEDRVSNILQTETDGRSALISRLGAA